MIIRSYVFLVLIAGIIPVSSCERNGNSDIRHETLNREFVLIRDVEMLRQSDDEISRHIDSILSGLIDEEFVSTGKKSFNLDEDAIHEIAFDIIDLNKYNPQGLPESFDSLAARVIPLSLQILDNSTYGYPDALLRDEKISGESYWSDRTSVLGTFLNGGKFQGQGERYLGVRIPSEGSYNYGWIKLYCSKHNDTLRIIEYAYNRKTGSNILAGQKE